MALLAPLSWHVSLYEILSKTRRRLLLWTLKIFVVSWPTVMPFKPQLETVLWPPMAMVQFLHDAAATARTLLTSRSRIAWAAASSVGGLCSGAEGPYL